MLSRRLKLLVGILLFKVLTVASEDSDHLDGKDNPCPHPVNPNMVQRPINTIKGKVGDTVILPCSTKDKKDISYDMIIWIKGPTMEPIYKYIWREHAIQIPIGDFINLTSLSEEGLLSGDCSLNLKVNTSHSGTYYCCVPERLYCLVNLEVLSEGEGSGIRQDDPVTPYNPTNGTGGQTTTDFGGVIAGGVIVAVLIIGLVVFCCRKRLKQLCSQINFNNPQTHPRVYYQVQQPPQDEGNEPVDK